MYLTKENGKFYTKCVFCGEKVEMEKECYSPICIANSEDIEVEELRREIAELNIV